MDLDAATPSVTSVTTPPYRSVTVVTPEWPLDDRPKLTSDTMNVPSISLPPISPTSSAFLRDRANTWRRLANAFSRSSPSKGQSGSGSPRQPRRQRTDTPFAFDLPTSKCLSRHYRRRGPLIPVLPLQREDTASPFVFVGERGSPFANRLGLWAQLGGYFGHAKATSAGARRQFWLEFDQLRSVL